MKALLLLLWLLPLWSWAKPEMIRPKVKTSTAFAIVVDRQSYDKVRTAVEAYRDAIEKDGLATWILIDDWESPAEIRALLKELYEDRRMPLEGTVFVGDIPVPMISFCLLPSKWTRNVPGISRVFLPTVIMTISVCSSIS